MPSLWKVCFFTDQCLIRVRDSALELKIVHTSLCFERAFVIYLNFLSIYTERHHTAARSDIFNAFQYRFFGKTALKNIMQ